MKVLSFAAVVLASVLFVAPGARAREVASGRRSKRLAAYAAGTERPIHAAMCPARYARTADGRCARAFKHAAARRLCERLGRGRHDWYYVVGTAERRAAVALCL